ncbi:MAG: S-adenosyl-l-methionine hydroxide adenosyltransferase family protein [Candidatus Bathyarchaeia archaeon]
MSSLPHPIITLLTDFGTKDAYVAAMKGAILQICPEARVVDISHAVNKFDIRHGAFLLAQASPYFPDGTIHVAVVDPGVGTERRRIIIQGRRSRYVGPDNGVLLMAARREGIERAVEITNPRYMLPNPSRTFEGRDIFAPASAYLAMGTDLDEFGGEVQDLVQPPFVEARVRRGKVVGEVIHIDGFGNVITNISELLLRGMGVAEGTSIGVRLGERVEALRFCGAYGEAPVGVPILVIGSSSLLEVSVNQGDASVLFKASAGDLIEISTTD